jgi:hypothetical protein
MRPFAQKAWRAATGLAVGFSLIGGSIQAQDEPDAPGALRASAKPAVRLHSEGSGRFEVVALPGAEGVRLAELAEAAWAEWAGPFSLPSRLPVAITVRLVPEAEWLFGDVPARVAADPAGVVSVWIREDEKAGARRERLWLTALAEGVLRRKAFLLGLDPAKAHAPPWLTAGAAEAVIVAEQPSMLDAWQMEFGRSARPEKLRDVLLWGVRGGAEAEGQERAAYGVWLWLREEGGKSGAWGRFVGALLTGESPGAALAREFATLTPKPAEAREWELAWKVAAARLVIARTTPILGAEESRQRLERLSRIVVMDARDGRERVMPAWGEWASRGESWPAMVRLERAAIIEAEFTRMHPFYRNAAGSLGRAWGALAAGEEEAWREASVEWSRDAADGRVLENASRALLDAAERR